MSASGADKEERLAAQLDAQKKLEEKKIAQEEARKKEAEKAKQDAILKAASKKR